ncbi:MAG: TonB-dependent receptor [Chitinophagaceae bacterium]|nr:TonB-dependent receptor [Chitinophagaceae bacterium]
MVITKAGHLSGLTQKRNLLRDCLLFNPNIYKSMKFTKLFWRVTKLISILIFAACMQVGAKTYSQITLSLKNAPLKTVFIQINEQTGFNFLYSDEVLANTKQVTLSVKNATLENVLALCFRDQPLNYSIVNNTIVVKEKPVTANDVMKDFFPPSPIDVKGKVVNEKGEPVASVTVTVKGTRNATATDINGEFTLSNVDATATLVFTSTNVETFEIKVNGKTDLAINLKIKVSKLDEVQVIGYGTTTKRKNTGSISTITAREIDEQPVTNVLSALSGRAAGVFVQTTNGLPGGRISIQIRGKGSIAAGTDPLYIIDGVPFSSSIIASNNILASGINGAVSPLNSLNPDDIESVSILKDADATAIYGSRGSNGVVLITTKGGKPGKTSVNLNISNGISQVSSLPRLLSPNQYLQIRREAYKNDGVTPSSNPNDPNYAPDLTTWDTTKSTDWRKYLLGRTGHVTDAQAMISGGNLNTNFVIGGNFHSETSVLPGDNLYQRRGIHMGLQHTSENHKFYIQFLTAYYADKNQLSNITSNFTGDLLLPPDFPLYDSPGNYNYYLGWNPLADLSAISKINTSNIVINSLARYSIAPGLDLKTSVGYDKISINQVMTYPTNSQYQGSTNFTNFGNNSNENIIVEPQIEYNKQFGKSVLDLLAGGTYQSSVKLSEFTQASNFSSDLLLDNLSSATTFSISNYNIDYKNISMFARANYNFDEKYIFNVSVRRDGSSRFGPGNEFGNFGAIGTAWIFSSEDWFKNSLPFIGYGKLRGSYGLTGNDQITDYQYLSTYGSSGYIYQGAAGIQPSRIANANFHWETTRKLEFAIELGFFKNKILLNVNRYQNRTDDQLVTYAIPYLTGFNTYQANLPAVVQNSGWEFEINTKNLNNNTFSWTTAFNLTIPKSELLSFQNLATSSYANTLVIGEPITRLYGYKFTGLDSTGVPLFQTQSKGVSPSPSSATDQFFSLGKGYPDFYGGIGNTFTYHKWELNIFGQFVRQSGMGGLTYTPGIITNNFVINNNRWQKPGDQTNIPKSSNSYAYYSAYSLSSANFFNTSYFRIKNISLSYAPPAKWLKRNKIQQLRIYLQGQNLFTFWNKNVPIYDPEAGAGTNIPPMKTLIAGIQITL